MSEFAHSFEVWRAAFEERSNLRFEKLEKRVDVLEVGMSDLKSMVTSIAAGVARIEGWEKYFQQVAEVHAALVPERLETPDPDPTPDMRGRRE